MRTCKTCMFAEFDRKWGEYRCQLFNTVMVDVDHYDCTNYKKGPPTGHPPPPPPALTTNDHNRLRNRNAINQHPIGSINGLEDELRKKLNITALDNAIEQALSKAQMSGMFDGEPGQPGEPGHTPVKGVDYWTEEDKSEIVSDVVEQIGDEPLVVNTDHSTLTNRDAADAHPISAITSLKTALDSKLESAGFITNMEIQEIFNS